MQQADGTVSPSNATVDYKSTYVISCNTGYTLSNSSQSTVTCQAGGILYIFEFGEWKFLIFGGVKLSYKLFI